MKSFHRYLTDAIHYDKKTLGELQATRKAIIQLLDIDESDCKCPTRNKIIVFSDTKREAILEKISKLLLPIGWQYKQDTSISTTGHLQNNNLIIVVKPKAKQGIQSAGKSNEILFVEKINQALTEHNTLSIVIKSSNKIITYTHITQVIHVGDDSVGGKKADVILVSKNKRIPISIKKSQAIAWESADTYWGNNAYKYINALTHSRQLKITAYQGGHYKITPCFAVKATRKEAKSVIFGTDILQHDGCVVEKDFTDGDFSLVKNKLTITVDNIINEVSDINENTIPWFLVRNDSSRRSVAVGYDGIRVLAVKPTQINTTIMKVKRDLIK